MTLDLVTYADIARRIVDDGLAPSMTRERVRQLAATDPTFPKPEDTIGRSRVYRYAKIRKYFLERDARPGPKLAPGKQGQRRTRGVDTDASTTREAR